MLSFARAVAFCALLYGSALVAQNVGTGLYPHGTFDRPGFDAINMGNLNTHFEIPIVQKAGRGLPFNYSIVYDGLIWSTVTSSGTAQWTPDSAYGFHGQLNGGAIVGYLTNSTLSVRCVIDNRVVYARKNTNYVYHDPFGRSHRFLYTAAYSCPDQDYPAVGDGSSTDGSGYTFDGSQVHSSSGKVITPNSSTNVGDGSITDANGNTITDNSNGTYTDTTGTTELTIAGGGNAGSPLTLTYPVVEQGNGATTATATIYYKTYTVQTAFGCSPAEYPVTSVDLVDHITLATGDTYTFGYEATPNGSSGNVSGRLASIRLPTGGTISYSYSGGTSGINCSDGSTEGLVRTTTDGTRSYTRPAPSQPANTTLFTDERGKQSYYWFSVDSAGAYEMTHRRAHDGTASNTNLLEEDIVCYNNQTTSNGTCDGQAITSPITEADASTTFNYVGTAVTTKTPTIRATILPRPAF